MPEGPEVETVVRTLEKQIQGNQIIELTVCYPKIIDSDNFYENVINKTFKSFSRKGKFLILGLNDGYLVVHLRMEGKFYIDTNDVMDKHTHVRFKLDDGRYLKYHDTRKFGRLGFVNDLRNHKGLNNLGPDVLDSSFNLNYLRSKLSNRTIPIKQVLLDQTVVAGIGNIYANEILFRAKIHPNQQASTLSSIKINRIIKHAKEVIQEAIAMGGTTIRSYTSSLNVHGRFDQVLNVHAKDICPICLNPIKKIYINKRGTYYCPHCQKLKK